MVKRFFTQKLNLKEEIYSSNGFLNQLKQLSILDPAIGTGHFIFGILNWIEQTFDMFYEIGSNERKDLIKLFVRNNLYGIEINQNSLDKCKNKILGEFSYLKEEDLKNLKVGNTIVDTDIYTFFPEETAQKLNPFSWKKSFDRDKFDIILGNPPYFNIKEVRREKKENELLYTYLKNAKYWKKYFRSSSDIYYYFIIKALDHLNPDGLLSFIIPNYWINNTYADKLRKKIYSYKIEEIIDFGEFPVFYDQGEKINISSCILNIRNSEVSNFFRVYRYDKRKRGSNLSIVNIPELNFEEFRISQKKLGNNKWILSPQISKLETVFAQEHILTLNDFADIGQGVSPGVKQIFMVSEKEKLQHNFEEEVLVPFVTNKHIQKWITEETKTYAIQPSKISSLTDYPNVQEYLKARKALLVQGSDRKRLLDAGKIRWFDYSVYRNLSLFCDTDMKILTPYRKQYPCFSLDRKGFLGATDVYTIVPKKERYILYLLGILNSSIIEFWFKEAGKKKGRMIEFFSRDLKRVPIPIPRNIDEIESVVRAIISTVRKNTENKNEIMNLKKRLDQLVLSEFQVDYDLL